MIIKMKVPKKTIVLSLIILLSVFFLACAKVPAANSSNQYSLLYIAASGGTISGATSQIVAEGGSGTEVIAVPETGYKFVRWSDNETEPTRTDTNITATKSITAYFERESFAVIYNASTGGAININSMQNVLYGDDALSITAEAIDGYRFVKWSDNNSTDPVRQDFNITENMTVSAIFEKRTYTINYIAGVGGIINGDDKQSVFYGDDSETITAEAIDGYRFVKWSDNNSTDPVRQDFNIAENMTVSAIFEKRTYTINYVAEVGGEIIGETEQFIKYNESSCAVEVAQKAGYMFVGWSDGYGFETRWDIVTDNIAITARFMPLFGGGDGSVDNPLLVDSYEQLVMINLFPDSHYRLTTDLDLSGINHLPMFHWGYMFEGSFDGDGHTISNMTIDRYLALPSLFGSIGENGEVRNLNISDFSIAVQNYNTTLIVKEKEVFIPLCVGAVAGISYGKLTNVFVSGTIMSERLDYHGTSIGGIVGQMHGEISYCVADIIIGLKNVNIGGNYDYYALNIGGIVGILANNMHGCSTSGIIDVNFTDNQNYRSIGGVIGVLYDSSGISVISITNCTNEIDISCNMQINCGGLFAYSTHYKTVNVSNCQSSGNIATANIGIIGGLIGYIDTVSGSITDCFVTGDVQGDGGFISNIYSVNKNFRITNCFASGNVYSRGVSAGFVRKANGVNVYRCYASGNIQSDSSAAGFAFDIRGTLEECFSLGDITAISASGFVYILSSSDSYIKNCYSASNIFTDNSNPYSTIIIAGLVGASSGSLINCYYTGKIVAPNSVNSIIGAIAGLVAGTVNNCHWILHEDSIAQVAIAQPKNSSVVEDICVYSDITDIYPTDTFSLAAILDHDNQIPVWVDVPNKTPTFAYIVEM